MPYQDFVIATPEITLVFLLNLCPFTTGLGTSATAFWKKDGFCIKTFLLGLIQHLITFWSICFPWLLFISWFIALASWIFGLYHTYNVYKASRAVYMK